MYERMDSLDAAYLEFSTESNALETLLGARYGVAWTLVQGSSETPKRVFVRWHQIRDLLTLYYFNVKEDFPGKSLSTNSKGYNRCYHSGLNAAAYFRDPRAPLNGELETMRADIRTKYDEALKELCQGLLDDPIHS